MITAAIIDLFGILLLTFLELFPPASAATTPSDFVTTLNEVFSFIYQWNYLFPITGVLTWTTFALLFWVVWFFAKAVFYMVAFVRGN